MESAGVAKTEGRAPWTVHKLPLLQITTWKLWYISLRIWGGRYFSNMTNISNREISLEVVESHGATGRHHRQQRVRLRAHVDLRARRHIQHLGVVVGWNESKIVGYYRFAQDRSKHSPFYNRLKNAALYSFNLTSILPLLFIFFSLP